jgi:hypothetical protein
MARYEFQHVIDYHDDQIAPRAAVCRWGNKNGLSVPDLFDYMAELGRDGWELAAVADREGWTFYYFKRLVTDA